ncbi:MAG: hypothetical protein REI09_05850 [Candidatus Dactylopiibacterium sp.]|nr:hypothetical protein [Candidatus Dactylopiibacterium sp.]
MDVQFTRQWLEASLFRLVGFNRRSAAIYQRLLSQRRCASCARNYAAIAMRSRRYAEAETALLKLLEWEPADALGWHELGRARLRLGLARPAAHALRHAVQLNPELDDAWLDLGQAHLIAHEYAYAIAPLRRAHALAPLSPLPLYLIGLCQHHCGNEAALRDMIARVAEIDPQRADLLVAETRPGAGRIERVLF